MLQPCLTGDGRQVAEVALPQHRRGLQAGEPAASHLQGGVVPVDAEQASLGPDPLQDELCVAAEANGAVDDDRSRSGSEELYGLF